MSENSASIKISIKDGQFEIKGSELFVTQQIENFKDLIIDSLQNENPVIETNTPTDNRVSNEVSLTPVVEELQNENTNQYERVLHIENGVVNIIKNLPSKSAQSKTVLVAIILTYANKLAGRDETTYKEVSEECKKQACYDVKNFSSHLKGTKPYIVINGTTRTDKVLKLTMPGIEHAEKLLSELNAS